LKALRDWPAAWYTGAQRVVFAEKRRQQGLIASEYKRYAPEPFSFVQITNLSTRLNRDDEAFKAAYPAAMKGIKELVRAITNARIERGEAVARTSKKGRLYEQLERQSPVVQG
jgi:hypothetical protein